MKRNPQALVQALCGAPVGTPPSAYLTAFSGLLWHSACMYLLEKNILIKLGKERWKSFGCSRRTDISKMTPFITNACFVNQLKLKHEISLEIFVTVVLWRSQNQLEMIVHCD